VGCVFAGLTVACSRKTTDEGFLVEEVAIRRGTVRAVVKTVGTVEPQNRLEVKPPISGRLEEILVKEGDRVKKGQIIGWMSSTERAALLDAATAKGGDELAYWREACRPTPIIAPIDGDIIVCRMEPGQAILTTSSVVVIADRLIIKARVDETDIGRVKAGQPVLVRLDAYPDVVVSGRVAHISYEATLVNNVTVYEVDIAPAVVPEIFRSGMNAEVAILIETRENVLVAPVAAVMREDNETYVLTRAGGNRRETRRPVRVGLADEEQVEIAEGLREGETVLVRTKVLVPADLKPAGRNPFMPFGRRRENR